MPKKILFVFAGTGDNAENMEKEFEKPTMGEFPEDVIRVYFNGCQDKKIGGQPGGLLGQVFPDLDVVGSKTRACFNQQGELSLSELKNQFGKSIIIRPDTTEPTVEVESINLTGFSRGAVTTFSVARHLNDVGKPISLFAMDPVPGESKDMAKKEDSQFYKNHDLRACTNLKHAEVVLGTYANNINLFHNSYFKQMVPHFNEQCNAAVYRVPKTHHMDWSAKADNQQIDFLAAMGLKRNIRHYVDAKDKMHFVPKVLAQKLHIGNAENIVLLPLYKEKLLEELSKKYSDAKNFNVKTALSLHALEHAPDSPAKITLVQKVISDKTTTGKALREFITEFENINQSLRAMESRRRGRVVPGSLRAGCFSAGKI